MLMLSTANEPFAGINQQRSETILDTLVARYNEWNAQRKTREILSRLSPEQLDDIGLTKGDIADMFLIRG